MMDVNLLLPSLTGAFLYAVPPLRREFFFTQYIQKHLLYIIFIIKSVNHFQNNAHVLLKIYSHNIIAYRTHQVHITTREVYIYGTSNI